MQGSVLSFHSLSTNPVQTAPNLAIHLTKTAPPPVLRSSMKALEAELEDVRAAGDAPVVRNNSVRVSIGGRGPAPSARPTGQLQQLGAAYGSVAGASASPITPKDEKERLLVLQVGLLCMSGVSG